MTFFIQIFKIQHQELTFSSVKRSHADAVYIIITNEIQNLNLIIKVQTLILCPQKMNKKKKYLHINIAQKLNIDLSLSFRVKYWLNVAYTRIILH